MITHNFILFIYNQSKVIYYEWVMSYYDQWVYRSVSCQ